MECAGWIRLISLTKPNTQLGASPIAGAQHAGRGPVVNDADTPTIEVQNVSKSFPIDGGGAMDVLRGAGSSVFPALSGVTFQIRRGETVGFLGTNGAGKSTLLQLIAGTMQPTSGSVKVRGRISALLELGAGFNPEWTGRRNSEFFCMIHGASKSELPALLRSVAEFADIGDFFERPMRTYSSGMFLRVAFAAAVAIEPDVMIVDEALAVGDARFQNKCFDRFKQLQDAGKTIIFVTHDTVMMSRFCTRGIVLKSGRVILDGSPGDAVKVYRQVLYGGQVGSELTKGVEEAPAAPLADNEERDVSTEKDPLIAAAFSWPPNPALLATRAHYNSHERSAGVGTGQIIDVQLLDARRHLKSPLVNKGERLGIAMQISSAQRVLRPCYGIVIKSKDNVYLFGVTNILLGREMPSIQAGETVAVCFDIDTRLSRGDYFIDVGFSDMTGEQLTIIEWRMSVAHFSVHTSSEIYGFLDLHAEFSLSKAPVLPNDHLPLHALALDEDTPRGTAWQ